MAETKNIIFDLGGVLINIDYDKTRLAFEKFGFDNFNQMYSQYTADFLFDRLETGKVTEEEFFKALLQQKPGATMENMTKAWNAMILDFRKPAFDFLKTLEKNYNLYLLSNTNSIHIKAFNAVFTRQTGYKAINDFFAKAYYSNEIGLRKPNKDVFEFVLKNAGIRANESLFIDDSFNNIETARELGFKTHLLLPGETIENLDYDDYLISSKSI